MVTNARQKDIAKKTGFSINTISLALNGSERISDESKEKILQVAKELNYIPNNVARSLVQKKTQTVGVILTELTNPILTVTAQQIEQKLMSSGYTMILMTTSSNPKQEANALDILISHQVDGILMYPVLSYNSEKIIKLRNSNYPIILLGSGEHYNSSDAVYIDKKAGAYKATNHLAGLGHRKIAFIRGGMEEEKLNGYKAALKVWGYEYDADIVIPVKGTSYKQGYQAAEILFNKSRPSAIFASTDYLALGALSWCREHNLRVPQDIGIVGYDDVEAARFAEVPLTSITYIVDEETNKAVDLLFELMMKKEELSSTKPIKIAIEPSLIIRQSCGAKIKNI